MNIETVISKFDDSERIEENLSQFSNPETDIIIKQNYPEHLLDALNIFRFVLKENEYTKRAFDLSRVLSNKIKNHYAVWTYRKKYLIEQKDATLYETELLLVNEYILEEPKGFQIWDHKRFCFTEYLALKGITITEDIFDEQIEFLDKVFGMDSKNYHAWAYRTWLIGLNSNFVMNEKNKLEILIEKDVENNSYWSYYHYLVSFDPSEESRNNVKAFAMKMVNLNLKNEAAWNFVNSLYVDYNKDYEEYLLSKMIQNVRFIEASCIFNQLKIKDDNQRDKDLLKKCFKRLIEELDTMRQNYWIWLAEQSKINLTD